MVFATHQCESAIGIRVPSILTTLSLYVVTEHQL